MPPAKLPPKPAFDSYELPESKRRRGSFVVRLALQTAVLRQHPAALKSASRILLLLPFVQAAILVGILDAERWLLFLCAEGLLIAWLASSQLSRPNPESRLIGYGIGVLNVGALAAVGAFLGVPVLWLTGALALLPFSWLVLVPTRARTVKAGWAAFVLPLLLLATFAGYGRLALEKSRTEGDPAARSGQLDAAWDAMRLRGFNDTERALLRLRQGQTAFATGDYDRAFWFANDGMQNDEGVLRPIPRSSIGQELLESLIMLKAQAYYNRRWDKADDARTPIEPEALPPELLAHEHAKVKWGW
ncbi:MAG: hypothetical protein IPK87_14425 [Planctomycetes bacterium]|nr:hypothetical protein [Planctomycetota bacterium]